ncbi:hypothetical protein EIP91_003615 [Steccherinum ochraceum]|uniref:Uncharacterized protein n=1 Tax=Steccherinum ochraceum TaxID=92696 RepID=A0A4R0RDL5_9APHY|nr:hypothetical protein EIP91_003615 [Steccherinum ochraceum]
MHKVFRIVELVDAIVEQVAERDWTYYDDHRDHRYRTRPLAEGAKENVRALGQVARSFRKPCLDANWYHGNGILELLFMVGAVEAIPDVRGRKSWELVHQLEQEDVSAVLFFSSRIQELVWDPEHSLDESAGDDMLLPLTPVVELFPRLRVLVFEGRFEPLDLLFVLDGTGSALTELRGILDPELADGRLLTTIIQKRRDLVHLGLQWYRTELPHTSEEGEDGTASWAARMTDMILQEAHNLSDLILDDKLSWLMSMWDRIPSHPNLTALSLSYCFEQSGVPPRGPACPMVYRSLIVMDISVENSGDLTLILENVKFTTLRTFRLELVRANCGARNTLDTIVRCCATSPLKSLTIGLRKGVVRAKRSVLGPEDIRSLLNFRLEVLDIDAQWNWEMDLDEVLRDILRAWGPGLKVLHLDPNGNWSMSTPAHRENLEMLAEVCQDMTNLGVQLDLSALVPIQSSDAHPRKNRNESLKHLAVGWSRFVEGPGSLDVARYLSSIFPKLEQVIPADFSNHADWEQPEGDKAAQQTAQDRWYEVWGYLAYGVVSLRKGPQTSTHEVGQSAVASSLN